MELELKRTEQPCYARILDTTIRREETLEVIVPDACPDILRVLNTEGRPCLGQREVGEGEARLSGTVRMTVLYQPDGTDGLWSLEAEIPVQCTAEHGELTGDCVIRALPRIVEAETRVINPRKVLLRVELAIPVQGYAPRRFTVCSGVEDGQNWGIQQRVEQKRSSFIACVRSKEFSFSDQLTIPGSRPAVSEVLKSRCSVYCAEEKLIGNKLIFKGGAGIQLLCRGEDASLFSMEFELPYSQIMEASGVGEEGSCQMTVEVTGWHLELDESDGRRVDVELTLLAQAVVREERELELLTDAYSTMYTVAAEPRPCPLETLLEQGVRRQNVREILETGALARTVADVWVDVGELRLDREGERCVLTADTRVTVLYEGEEGEYLSAVRQIPVTCPMELPMEGISVCRCVPVDVQASATAGGIETRYGLDLWLEAVRPLPAVGLWSVQLDEDALRDTSGQPSLVLRRVAGGETLWEIAKAYYTTTEEIVQANELEEELPAVGQMLLIPRKRG